MTTTYQRQQGFSLIELMVAATISMVVVLAASSVYLTTRQTQSVLTEKAGMFEGARVALEIIGRDLENAGYYPAEYSPNQNVANVSVVAYQNPCINPRNDTVSFCAVANQTPFNTGIFGCSGQRLLRSGSGTYACAAHVTGISATQADALVVNYYTVDSTEKLHIGQRGDCEGQDVANDAINSRNKVTPTISPLANPNRLTYDQPVGTITPSIVPNVPLFVSNRYSLSVMSNLVEGVTVNTFSMACDGNGNDNDSSAAAASIPSPMVSGIEQLRFLYLARTAAGMSQYMQASAVTDWTTVVGVRVCVLARSLQSTQAASYNLTDCAGADTSHTDGFSRKVFTQSFALKNMALD